MGVLLINCFIVPSSPYLDGNSYCPQHGHIIRVDEPADHGVVVAAAAADGVADGVNLAFETALFSLLQRQADT